MATNFDKMMTPISFPQELMGPDAADATNSDVMEIEILAPEGMEDEALAMGLGVAEEMTAPPPFDANLAEYMDEDELSMLSTELRDLVEGDMQSRADWSEMFVKGLEVLGFNYEERTQPWEGACGVHSTVLSEAAIRFQAETMSETFPAAGPVRTKILGEETKEKKEAADRVRADMNYELTERMVEYRPEHERMLYSLGLAGSAFKKVYFDPKLGRQVALYVSAEDVIVPYGATHLVMAERVTHVMRKTENELALLQASGFYRDVELGTPKTFHTDIQKHKAEEDGYELTEDNRYTLYEIHCELILDDFDQEAEDETQLAKPYVVTIDESSCEVLSIRRNWKEEDPKRLKRDHFVHYCYLPGFGFYGLGLIHIIGGYARAGTSLIRQLVDAGTLANLQGGFKARGLRVKGDDTPIAPGEFRDVDVPSGSIRDNLLPLPFKEPSQTLLALLDRITDEGRRLGAISDLKISDMSAQAPVGTTLAILERTLKPMAAVQARVHYAMKQEFKMLKAIISEQAPEFYSYQPERGEVSARREDYAMVEVIPVSDPNSSTMAQRVVQYQAVLQMAQNAPQIYDLPQLHRQMIEVLGVKNAEKLIPASEDAKPLDPISENMNALNGTPVKAFIYQDHDAHIATHMSFIQNPMIGQGIGQNPMAQQIMASLQAHIAEHLAFKYRAEIEQKLGAPMPPPGEELHPDVELQLSRLVADASQQLTQQKQQEMAAQQAQQQAQDPMLQLKQMEVQTKQQEVQRKATKDAMDAQIRQQEQQRKAIKDELDAKIAIEQLAVDRREVEMEAQKIAAQLGNERTELDNRIKTDQMNQFLQMVRGRQNG